MWTLIGFLLLALVLALLCLQQRRVEHRALRSRLSTVTDAKEKGSHKARLQFPNVDLSRCLGCGTCIRACPEEGVLDLIHGQAVVIHGARCVGHGLCARACPVDAITVTLGDMSSRRDIPAVTSEWEVPGTPGLFLAGEVTGYALVKTAIHHGTAVADVVHARTSRSAPHKAPRSTSPVAAPGAASGTLAEHPVALPDSIHSIDDILILGAVGPSADRPVNNAPVAATRVEPEGDLITVKGAATAAAVALALEPIPATETAAPPARPHAELPSGDHVHDLVIVGSGPAGLACSLRAKELGLDFVTLEQEETFGGTVAKYPRRKLVMTQPVELPLYGMLKKSAYIKEDLMEIWERVLVEHELPIRTGEVFEECEQDGDIHRVRTAGNVYHARNVCLALGRRGSPRKLGIPGEDLPKVVYSLVDASSYTDRHILVVGGGDSAIEAAIGLAEQPGNTVTLSYRKKAFFRIKAKNEHGLDDAVAAGRLQVLFESNPAEITPDEVLIHIAGGDPEQPLRLRNDDTFIMAGGIPPFTLLEKVGVSFDPEDRDEAAPIVEQGTGLRIALLTSLGLTLIFLGWFLHFRGYYSLPREARFDSPQHDVLRPMSPLGFGAALGGSFLIVVNLCYLIRRSRIGERLPGSLKAWMTSHVVTGILAMLLILVHSAMLPRNSLGGHAFWSLVVLMITGAIGRYFYAFVPRAANGKELALDELQSRFAEQSQAWDEQARGFGNRVRQEIQELVTERRWHGSFFSRVKELLLSQRGFVRFIADLRRRGRKEGLDKGQIALLTELSRRAYKTALMAAHYEDLRALLGSWRFVHRWFGLLMVLLATWHIVTALKYSRFFQ